MKPWDRHRRQVATYWPVIGRVFQSPDLLEPGGAFGGVRWQRVLTLARDSESAAGAEQPTVVSPFLLQPGAAVALGDHVGTDPLEVEEIHEVASVRESRTLMNDAALYRASVRPLRAVLQDQVTVYAMDRVSSGRSYTVERGAELYSGPATVDQGSGPARREWAGSPVAEWDTLVTVPATPALRQASRVEIEWNGPAGLVVLDGQGPIWHKDWSPIYTAIAATTRKPQT